MHEFERRFGELVIQYRWLVIIGCLLLVGLMASGAKNLSYDHQLPRVLQ